MRAWVDDHYPGTGLALTEYNWGGLEHLNGALALLVINKTAGALTGDLALSGFTPSGPAQVYRYSAANLNAILPQPDQALTPAGFNAAFPANSLTLLVIPGTADLAYVYVPLLSR